MLRTLSIVLSDFRKPAEAGVPEHFYESSRSGLETRRRVSKATWKFLLLELGTELIDKVLAMQEREVEFRALAPM